MAAASERTAGEGTERQMDERHKKILWNTCRDVLMADMDPGEILTKMAADEIFKQGEEDEIKGKETRDKKCEELLSKLSRKSAKAYPSFKKALQIVHPHLATAILEAGKRF